MKTLYSAICIIALLIVTACQGPAGVVTSASTNLVRLTEFDASYPLVGGVTGCQVSEEGAVQSDYTLETANCKVTVKAGELVPEIVPVDDRRGTE